VVLRAYSVTDAQTVWEAIEETRGSLLCWMPDIGRHRTPAEVGRALAALWRRQAGGECLVFGVWERSSGRLLGEVGLYQMDRPARRAEVGYWLRATAWGQGYASEALGLLVDHASADLGLQRFEAHVAAENQASRRVAERLGFRPAGHRVPIARWDGEAGEVLIYARGPGAGGPGAIEPDRPPRRSIA
jgi:RimJ/RimL family protein N-acetyltransferase